MNKDDIPNGHYCYKPILIGENGKLTIQLCPYWSNHLIHGHQNSGHCSYLNIGDWESDITGDTTYLWDQVKECGINLGEE